MQPDLTGLSPTGIEYGLNPNGTRGLLLPVVTGCLHGLEVCATSPTCWARTYARRNMPASRSHYRTDFQPKYNRDVVWKILRYRQPRTFLVAFTGELFGAWVATSYQDWIMQVIRHSNEVQPGHVFVFLTKNPGSLARLNPWPDNCWPGTSITGAEAPEIQQERLAALLSVRGGHPWVSFEPLLGPPALDPDQLATRVEWFVVGAQTGARAIPPRLEWLPVFTSGPQGPQVWYKSELVDQLHLMRRQQLPWAELSKRQRAKWEAVHKP